MLIKPLIIGKLPVKYEDTHYTTRTFIFIRTKSCYRCYNCDFRNRAKPDFHCARYSVLKNDWSVETLYGFCTRNKHYRLYRVI